MTVPEFTVSIIITQILAIMAVVVSILYAYKAIHAHSNPFIFGKEAIYAIKVVVWLFVAGAFFAFPHLSRSDGHILILVSWVAIILVEVGYNILYLKNIARDIREWIRK